MKKIIALFVLILIGGISFGASPSIDGTMKNAISKYYKGNYAGCLQDMKQYVEKKPNALAYYYIGMSYTQAGFKEEAIEGYDKAIEYAQKEKNYRIEKYAKLGKLKVENNDSVNFAEAYQEIDDIINNAENIPEEMKDNLRKKHIEYLRNEMNSSQPPKF